MTTTKKKEKLNEASENLKRMEKTIPPPPNRQTIGHPPPRGEWYDSSTRDSKQNAKLLTKDVFLAVLDRVTKSTAPSQEREETSV